MANAMSVTSSSPMSLKQTSVVGLVSMVAVLHSHIYWFYSVMYIAYNKMSPDNKASNRRWRSYQGKIKHSNKRNLSHKKSEKRLSIISSAKPTSSTLLLKKSVPLLKALETYPSAKKQSFDIRQFIKAERKTPKRIHSTGHMKFSESKLQPLIEVDTRQQVPMVVVSSSDDEVITGKLTNQIGRKRSNSKRDKALILLRSTFHRSSSNNSNKENLTATTTTSLSSEEQQVPAPVPKKRRRRNTLLGITRKFSARNNSSSSFSQKQSSSEESLPSIQSEPTKKESRSKLFRSLPLWKNKK